MTKLEKLIVKRSTLETEIPKLEEKLKIKKSELSKVVKEIEEKNKQDCLSFMKKNNIDYAALVKAFGGVIIEAADEEDSDCFSPSDIMNSDE